MGRSHNLWHRACLMLEQMAFENGPTTVVKNRPGSEFEFEPVTNPHQVSFKIISLFFQIPHICL